MPEMAPLLSEMRLEHRMTELLIAYATTGTTLLKQLSSYLDEDTAFLDGKTETEERVINYLEDTYSFSEAKNTPPDDFSAHIYKLYLQENIEDAVIKYVNNLMQSETILARINDDKPSVTSYISAEAPYLNELKSHIWQGGVVTDSFRASAERLYLFLVNKNQGGLSADHSFNNQHETLKSFRALINFTNLQNYREDLKILRDMYEPALDYAREAEAIWKRSVLREADARDESDADLRQAAPDEDDVSGIHDEAGEQELPEETEEIQDTESETPSVAEEQDEPAEPADEETEEIQDTEGEVISEDVLQEDAPIVVMPEKETGDVLPDVQLTPFVGEDETLDVIPAETAAKKVFLI